MIEAFSKSSVEEPVASNSNPASTAAGEDIFVTISKGNEQGVRELIAADKSVVNAKGPVSNHLSFVIAYPIDTVSSMAIYRLTSSLVIYS